MDGWKMSFLLGFPIFRGYVKLREGTISMLYPIGTYWEESDPQDGDPFLFTGRQERVLLKVKFYVSQNIPLGP